MSMTREERIEKAVRRARETSEDRAVERKVGGGTSGQAVSRKQMGPLIKQRNDCEKCDPAQTERIEARKARCPICRREKVIEFGEQACHKCRHPKRLHRKPGRPNAGISQ